MNPQEIQKQNIENNGKQNIDKKENKEQINIPKAQILSKYPNFDTFSKTINTLDENIKNKLLYILNSIPDDELSMYLEMDADNSNLVTNDDINRFIKEKDNYSNSKIFIENKNDTSIKNETTEEIKLEGKKTDITEEKEKTNEIKQALKTLESKKEDFKKIFGENSEFFQLFEKYKNEELATELSKFLSKPENRKAVFDKLAASGDEKLYKETYQSLSSLSPTIAGYLSDISPVIYKIEKLDGISKEDKSIIAQFPNAKPGEIEKRGDLVSYGDKTIDLKTGKAYISGEKGYSIETSMQVPNSLDLRVKYQKERLEILEEIKTNEKILDLLKDKTKLKENLEKLKSQKSSEKQNQNDLELDTQINLVEKEIKKIDEKLKTVIPQYKGDQDEALGRFLEHKIEKSRESLKSLKEKFDEDMQELLNTGKEEIKARDEKVRDTINFLDDLGITNINQNDLQKIINRININPQAYGFSKKIDLKSGFEGSATDSFKQKKEFFKFFSKIYEKMNFNPPVNETIVEGFTKDSRLKEDTTFKQKLEDLGVTTGGSIQIETFFNIINEKPGENKKQEK